MEIKIEKNIKFYLLIGISFFGILFIGYLWLGFISWIFSDPLNIVKDLPKQNSELCIEKGGIPNSNFWGYQGCDLLDNNN